MGPLDVGTWRDGGRGSIRLGQPGTTNSLHQATTLSLGFSLGQSFTRGTVPITVKPMRVYRRPAATQKTIASDSVANHCNPNQTQRCHPMGWMSPVCLFCTPVTLTIGEAKTLQEGPVGRGRRLLERLREADAILHFP